MDVLSLECEAALAECTPGVKSLTLTSRASTSALFSVVTLEGSAFQVDLSLGSGATTLGASPEVKGDSLHSLLMAASAGYGSWFLAKASQRLLQ